MHKDQIVFRSAIGGYHREDVNQYILRLNQELEELDKQRQSELDTQKTAMQTLEEKQVESEKIIAGLHESIDQINEEKEQLSLRAVQAESRLAEAEKNIYGLNQAMAKDCETIRCLREELTASKEALEKAENTLVQMKQEASVAENAIADAPSPDSEKSKKYDEISAQIGDILINANTSAEQILSAAAAKASQIVADTEQEETYIRTRLSDAADEMLSHISESLHTSTENCLSELLTALCEMRDRTDSLIRDFEARNAELSERVTYYQTNVTESIQKSIQDMDQKYGIRTGTNAGTSES